VQPQDRELALERREPSIHALRHGSAEAELARAERQFKLGSQLLEFGHHLLVPDLCVLRGLAWSLRAKTGADL
jgi:hypothetical protein